MPRFAVNSTLGFVRPEQTRRVLPPKGANVRIRWTQTRSARVKVSVRTIDGVLIRVPASRRIEAWRAGGGPGTAARRRGRLAALRGPRRRCGGDERARDRRALRTNSLVAADSRPRGSASYRLSKISRRVGRPPRVHRSGARRRGWGTVALSGGAATSRDASSGSVRDSGVIVRHHDHKHAGSKGHLQSTCVERRARLDARPRRARRASVWRTSPSGRETPVPRSLGRPDLRAQRHPRRRPPRSVQSEKRPGSSLLRAGSYPGEGVQALRIDTACVQGATCSSRTTRRATSKSPARRPQKIRRGRSRAGRGR